MTGKTPFDSGTGDTERESPDETIERLEREAAKLREIEARLREENAKLREEEARLREERAKLLKEKAKLQGRPRKTSQNSSLPPSSDSSSAPRE